MSCIMNLKENYTVVFKFSILCILILNVSGQIIRTEDDIRNAAVQAERMITLTKARTKASPDAIKQNLFVNADDLADRAGQALQDNVYQDTRSYNVSEVCLQDTETFLEALISQELWALKMVDAMGKPPSGILEAHFTWLGNYDECRSVIAQINATKQIKGKYCKTSFGQQSQTLDQQSIQLVIGLCVPNSCDQTDTRALLDTLLSLLPVNTSVLPQPVVMCQEESIALDTKAIVVIVICSLFGLVMVAATTYDVLIVHWLNDRPQKLTRYQVFKNEDERISVDADTKHYVSIDKTAVDVGHDTVVPSGDFGKLENAHTQEKDIYQPGILGKVLLSFSVYTNVTKLLNTNQPAGTLSSINGIRFLSMTWVMLGHSYGFGISVAENPATFMPEMLKRFSFQAIANATVSVDTFFTLSGLLVAYLTLKEIKKRGGVKKMNWGMFYFHRFWRLTPPYMLFLMFYVCLAKYWGDGPNWPQQGLEVDDCKDTWWKNLLYVNNIVDQDKQCMGWSWYLANDMQFYVLSPLMLIPLYISPLLGALSCLTFLLISFISTGIISSYYELGANIIGRNGGDDMEHVYMKPWCRVGPYAVGVFAGYILYKTNCKLRMPKILAFIGWLVAAGIALSVLYGLYDSSGFPTLNVPVSAFYNATSRSAWGLAVCWVIVACATGNGGFINSLLSWKGIIPLSRLTYCSYLVHLVVMDTYYLSKRSLVYLTDLEEIYMFFGHLCSTYIVALVVSLTFEAPMMGLEKALLGRNKRS